MINYKGFPTDILSIKKYGVDNWYKNYQPWPVSELEKYNISNDLYDSYSKLILESDDQDSSILVVLIRLLLEYHSLIYFELSLIRFKDSGKEPLFDDTAFTVFHNIYKKVYKGIFFIKKNKLNPDPLSCNEIIRNRLKSFYNCFRCRWRYNLFSKKFRRGRRQLRNKRRRQRFLYEECGWRKTERSRKRNYRGK